MNEIYFTPYLELYSLNKIFFFENLYLRFKKKNKDGVKNSLVYVNVNVKKKKEDL